MEHDPAIADETLSREEKDHLFLSLIFHLAGQLSHQRVRADLKRQIREHALPLLLEGNPVARQLVRCLECRDESHRCTDCWDEVHRAG